MYGVLSLTDVEQLLVNGLIIGTTYGLLGVAFGMILGVTGRFHFAFSLTYAVSAYVAVLVGEAAGMPFWLALVCGALAGAVLGVLIEDFVYRPLAARSGAYALLTVFVSSLGLAIAGENLLSIITKNAPSEQIVGVNIAAITIGPIDFTNLDVVSVVVSWTLIIALGVVIQRTTFGRMVQAVRINPEMSRAVGISPRTIYLAVFAIASTIGGVAAVVDAAKTAATANMGFDPLFYAFTVAFLAGTGRPPVKIALVGVGVGLIESLSSLFVSVQWDSLVVFVILFIYVALRPVEFRALLRKVSAVT